MADPILHPRVLRLWRQAEDLARSANYVRPLLPAQAPWWRASSRRWDESGPHQHSVPTLVACLAGVVRIDTGAGPIDLRPGQACAIAPAAWHAHAPLRRGSASYMQGLVFDVSDVLLADHEGAIALRLPAAQVRSLLSRLTEEPAPSLLRHLVDRVTGGPVRAFALHPAVLRMAQRMWAGLHEGVDTASVLAASGLGRRQAERLFTAWFGMPPARAILAQRLDLAKGLLRHRSSVTAAAAAAGFTSAASLTRAWRRVHGSPPSQVAFGK